jgi:transcriptional regulator with XRE-family HTH domain
MDFKDVAGRFKKTREGADKQVDYTRTVDPAEAFRIRARMVGLLVKDARLNAERSQEDCARLLRVTPEQVERWETGDEAPSLPQLELLAYYLDVPVSHFWGTSTLEASQRDYLKVQNEYIALRDRMVGALVRQAREERGMSLEALAETAQIDAGTLQHYELGELPIPMHELTVLANAVQKNLNYFLESSSQLGELLALREMWKHFTELPEDIRAFAANPLNVGFVEIAMMLAQMPTERLRRVGESVLNITM